MRTEVFTGELVKQQSEIGSGIIETKWNSSGGIKVRDLFTEEEWEMLSKQYSEICGQVEQEGLTVEILPDAERTTESVE